MTHKEAIKELKSIRPNGGIIPQRRAEAIDVAIEAIEKAEKYRWIPCSERLPENEEEVEITYKGCGGKFYTARAFHEDGTMHTEDSMMSCLDWLSWSDWCEYCEETDDWIIPKGWLEYVSFGDTYTVIDREVIAWMPLPEPFEEE